MSKELATLIEEASKKVDSMKATVSHGKFLLSRSDLKNPKDDVLMGIKNVVNLLKVEGEGLIKISEEIENKFF